MRVSFVTQEITTGLKRNLTMTIAVVITTAVSLALFGLAMLTGKQVDTMKDYWYDKVEVTLFLCLPTDTNAASCKSGAATEEQKSAISADLNKLKPLVEDVYFETKPEAYERFKERFSGSAIAENITPDALPESYRVKLSDPTKYDIIFSAFNGRPGVYQVQDQRTVLEPFFRVLRAVSIGALLLAGIILGAALLLIINTIRLSAYSRRRETGIMRLVGASNFYIRLPFILEGAIAGAVGAVLATILVVAAKWAGVDHYLEPNFQFTSFIGWDAVFTTIPWLFLFGVGGSALVSAVTLRRYLRV
ncbi:permease-like cell division protein FtsX [Sporichthya polymorpha]|uniref:permease-like cell division protein FtsX n=1 Tax=Sporichthya polymorpha TaxID=35751 RepID=UPI00036480DF|nr:permease-like cell division protein FtsX [Sporichthya polymorpha]